MLRKEDSNKVLKGIKTLIFTTGLSFLNTINVEAKEINSTQFIRENGEITPLLAGIAIGGIFTLSFIGTAIYNHNLNKKEPKNYDTELKDESAVTEKDGIEHIKIICK